MVLVCLLAVGLIVFRRSLVRTSVFVLCWSTISVFIPPSLEPVTLESARTVLVPFHGGGVAVTSLDVSVVQGGEYMLQGGDSAMSIENARGNAVCLLGAENQHVWAMDTHPGARIRMTVFSIVNELPEGAIRSVNCHQELTGRSADSLFWRCLRGSRRPLN